MQKPLVIDLFCGSFGWSAGFLLEGYRSIGFDIAHESYYGPVPEECSLVLQDVLTLHGSQFRDAAVIVASPPCQAYSYRAMPWKRAKALPPPSNELFDACFRIQREANYAAGHECPTCFGGGRQGHFRPCSNCSGEGWIYGHIPLVVENVKGAQPWVGRAAWHYGSFYLWGDVPALMPPTLGGVMKLGVAHRSNGETNFHGSAARAVDWKKNQESGVKCTGAKHGKEYAMVRGSVKGTGGSWFTRENSPDTRGRQSDGTKSAQDGLGGYGGSFGWNNTPMRRGNSRSDSRKAASAQIAKIPLPLAQHIARVYRP